MPLGEAHSTLPYFPNGEQAQSTNTLKWNPALPDLEGWLALNIQFRLISLILHLFSFTFPGLFPPLTYICLFFYYCVFMPACILCHFLELKAFQG